MKWEYGDLWNPPGHSPAKGTKHLAPTRHRAGPKALGNITTPGFPLWCDGPMRTSMKCRCCQKEGALTALKASRRPLFGERKPNEVREPLVFACLECDLIPGYRFQSQAVPPETPSV